MNRRWGYWRISVNGEVLSASPLPDFADDQNDDQAKNQKWSPEDPNWLCDTVSLDVRCVGSLQAAEHDDQVVADSHVFSKMDIAEEIHDIVANGGVIFSVNGTKEDHHIMPGLV
jgi:hypothetical protein